MLPWLESMRRKCDEKADFSVPLLMGLIPSPTESGMNQNQVPKQNMIQEEKQKEIECVNSDISMKDKIKFDSS